MAKSDPLFLLIKAMTKSEKRYFKLYTAKNELSGKKDYLRLFDAIEAQDEYDEKAILKKFRNEPYFSQLRSVKHYLYRQIVKSMKNIYDESSSSLKLNNYMIEVEMLYMKSLFSNCASTIQKAKGYAWKYENFPKLLELFRWESKIAIWLNDVDQIETLKRQWIQEEDEVLEKYNEIYQLKQLSYELQAFFLRKGYAKTETELQFVSQALANPLLKEKKKSFIGEVNRLSMNATCLLMTGQIHERYEVLKTMIEFCDQHPHQIEERLSEYFFNSRVLANQALILKKFAHAEQLIHKLDAFYRKYYTALSITNKVGQLNLQTNLYLRQGKFKEALALIDDMDELAKTNREEKDVIEDMYLEELKVLVYFYSGNFKLAQHHILNVISSAADVRLDMQTSARIAYLILQYEAKEYSHLDYIWRSTYRYLMRKDRLQEAESIVLKFLRRAKKLNSEKQILAALAEFKELILPYMDQFMVEFPLIEWIDSKLQNKPLIEVVRENYRKAVEKN